MFSEHLILLASIAQSDVTVASVLEIGTFDGRTAFILSRLFPMASVVTVDLPDADDEFSNTYNRKKSVSEFIASRDKFLNSSSNIEFQQMNSIELANWTTGFDLVWIDGAHGYPVVAMDVINSFRLCRAGGCVLIDDIWTSIASSDKYYKSIGGFESLCELKSARLINDFTLFPKRLNGQYNLSWQKKFVGFFRKV